MLKPDRIQVFDDIKWYMDTTAERGGVVSVSTVGSGGSPGDRNNVVAYAANPSGVTPMGLLLQDVVTYDTNRVHENWYKTGFQTRTGTKVLLDRKGRYTTNMIPSGVTIVAPQPAYLGASGLITNAQATGAPKVGTWISNVDQNGYAQIQLDIV